MTATDARFTVRIHPADYLVVCGPDTTLVSRDGASRLLGGREPVVFLATSGRIGCVVFELTKEGNRDAEAFCAQLNTLS